MKGKHQRKHTMKIDIVRWNEEDLITLLLIHNMKLDIEKKLSIIITFNVWIFHLACGNVSASACQNRCGSRPCRFQVVGVSRYKSRRILLMLPENRVFLGPVMLAL